MKYQRFFLNFFEYFITKLKDLDLKIEDFFSGKMYKTATKRVIEILYAKYVKADLPAIVKDNCSHLTPLTTLLLATL